MRDDAELLLLYAEQKSEEAFAELVRRHLGMVYAVALRRVGGHGHLAQDVAQEVFADLARKAAPLSRRGALSGWLFVSTRFAAAKAVRRDQQVQALREKIETMSELASTGQTETDWDELRPVLDEVVHDLSIRDREAVLLRFFENQTFAEVGASLHLTENAARMRVDRALDKLRRSLSRRGITSTSAALLIGLGGQAGAAVPSTLAAQITAVATTSVVPSSSILFYLMALTKTKVGVAVAIALAASAIVGIAQYREIRNLRAALGTGQVDADTNRLRLAELVNKLTASEEASRALSTQLEAEKDIPKSAKNKSFSANSEDSVVIHLKDVFRDHPEYVALYQKQQNRLLLARYRAGIAALHLSPDQTKKLNSLLEERETSAYDAEDLAIQSGAKAHSDEVNKATEQAIRSVDREIKALVGVDGFDKLESLQDYAGINTMGIGIYAADMTDAGIGLSSDQSQALAALHFQLSNGDKNPASNKPGFREVDPLTGLSALDQQLLERGAAILSPAQMEVMKNTMISENQNAAILKPYLQGKPGPIVITR